MPEPGKSKAPPAEPDKTPAPPAALSRFLDDARAFEPDQVVPFRDDPRAVQHNVGVGVAAVMEWADHVREHLPEVDLEELRSLPDLALCLTHASDAVDGGVVQAAEVRELLIEARALRSAMKASAVALAQAGVLAPKDLAKIGGDRGAVDAGADCLALAALFEKRAADVEGRTPITEEQIARAAEIGATLRAARKPKAAARKPGPSGATAIDTRDRLWTLLAARHERLWAVGAYVYGHAVEDHVPPVCAQPVKNKKPMKNKEI